MKKIILSVTAVMLIVCCSKNEENLPVADSISASAREFYATFEDPETKVALDEDGTLSWTEGDEVSIFTSTYNQKYLFTGQTGDKEGKFEKVDNGEFVAGGTISRNYAVYPYLEGTSMTYDEQIKIVLPSVQSYAENTFGQGANIMAAVTSDIEDRFLHFKNLCGYLVIKIFGNASVSSIVLEGHNHEKISGNATIDFPDSGRPVLTNLSNSKITLECGNIEIGKTPETATEFWFVVPPVTLNGFTIKVTDTAGHIIEQSYSGQIEISSNRIKKMEAFQLFTASIESISANRDPSSVDLSFFLGTDYYDDISSWGVICSSDTYYLGGSEYPQSGKLEAGENSVKIEGLSQDIQYAWVYVESTAGKRAYSNIIGIMPPVCVRAGDDLQAAINNAKQFQEIRVQGGASFMGKISMGGSNANKSVSGGWSSDFTEQSMDNLSVLDAVGGYAFWCAEQDGSPMNGYAKISYFEVKGAKGNHGTAFHCVGGPITISNCYVHDCSSEKGAIGTNEGYYQTTLTVVNCIVSNNVADAHGPVFGFGEGKSDDEPVKATIVGNLIVDNVSTKKDGYASTFICYTQTELIFVNNTVVGNKNWAEYGGPYSGMVLRSGVCSIFANNIFIGNFTSPCTQAMFTPEYEPQDGFLNMGGSIGTLANNIYEGGLKDATSATIQNQIEFPLGGDISAILTADYKPVGKAIGSGTLETIRYAGTNMGPYYLNIKELLEKYPRDLAGNPRVVGGKVDIGCYQAQ